uniref:HTH cro/C1-type domain-containing protein n=1 Tax=Magnetococcus massalia (strain MO-1) TaxID=451514 RepID=A0A1S7LG80_MAGMO|nr:protein of unknown function [Including DNA binding Helix-turn-helix protein domain] [Candidatus Magnetococcus massalia]
MQLGSFTNMLLSIKNFHLFQNILHRTHLCLNHLILSKKRWLSGDRSDAKIVEENQEYAFSLALIEARLAAGLTQKQAAKRAGLSTSTVARYESGHSPVIRLYAAAADALGLKLKFELIPISQPANAEKSS